MRRPAFASPKSPAIGIYVLLGAFAAITLGAIAADIWQYVLAGRLADGSFVSHDDARASDELLLATKGWQFITMAAAAGFFIWWTRRLTANLPTLGAQRPRWSPGWAISWWFVPVMAWFRPLQVLTQAWRAADPTLPLTEGEEWRRKPGSALMVIWWICWVVSPIVWLGAFGAYEDDSNPADLRDSMAFLLGMDVTMLALTALTVVVVVRLSTRQSRRNAALDLPAGMGIAAAGPGVSAASAWGR